MAEIAVLTVVELIQDIAGRRRGLEWPLGPQRIEQRSRQGDPIGDLDDALLANRIHRAELLDEPGMHLAGWSCLAASDVQVKDTSEAIPVFCR